MASHPANAADEIQQRQRASLLAIGTANPANCIRQDDYTDWYFRVTKSDHLHDLKAKMRRMCDRSSIKKRYFHHSERTIHDHPVLLGHHGQPSLDARQDMLAMAVPELAEAAAEDAIADLNVRLIHSWFITAAYRAAPPAVPCSAWPRTSRRTTPARVLVACAELTLVLFRAPDDAKSPGTLVMQAMFGDGASAAVVGADADEPVERPLFEMVSASQSVIPDTSDSPAAGRLTEHGFVFNPFNGMPALVRDNIKQCVADALTPLGLANGGWNDLFWGVQPGGRAILDAVEAGLALEPEKLEASRCVLREYGNMSGASMLFVLDELRRRRVDGGLFDAPPGGLGVMVGIGPGISVETMVLRAVKAT
ncbi:hypothetical protein QOZ80_9BG0713250 [Eleusine coracana subsp. coracana]|nr:hypothetical protein QOZ80_9BG0713250 [Eleusine coracana subsp. coracana]